MRIYLLGTVMAAALVLAGIAGAGGWATVGVAPMPPDGGEAGATWEPRLTILQHGRTPLDGVQPSITIRNDDTGATQTFPARPTGTSGVYAARVVFPKSGTWRYEIADGFSGTHTFAPITLAADGGGGGVPALAWLAAAAGLALGALLLLARRLRRQPELAAAGSR